MINTDEILEKLVLESNIQREDIPDIELYMDQVIQLFDAKFGKSLRSEDEKVLTKTMINNYAKGKLFIPIKNKKYSKQHIMLMSMIYQLKGALSINDIKATLDPVNERVVSEKFDLESYYSALIELQQKNVIDFKEQLKEKETDISNEAFEDPLKQILFIASLANMSNAYRKAAEVLVDNLVNTSKKKEGKK